MTYHGITFDRDDIRQFCEANHIRKLALFGSILDDRFTEQSDVDVLVEFEESHQAGLLKMAALENALSEKIGRKVDLRTPSELSRYFVDDVMNIAQVQYHA